MKTHTQNVLKTFAAAVTLAAAFAAGAQAADAPQVHVGYADLNLRTPAGVAALHHRIKVAALEVCGAVNERDLERRAQFDTCMTRAIAEATAAVKSSTQLASIK